MENVGRGYSILWDGQGISHERARLKPSLEEVRVLAKLVSGGRAFHTGRAATAQVLRRECLACEE